VDILVPDLKKSLATQMGEVELIEAPFQERRRIRNNVHVVRIVIFDLNILLTLITEPSSNQKNGPALSDTQKQK